MRYILALIGLCCVLLWMLHNPLLLGAAVFFYGASRW